ncbi:MAG: hypothetical protein RhofKO_28030 [Rhodothermales bacterium]
MSCQTPRSASDGTAATDKMDVILRSALRDAPADSTLRLTLRVRQPWSESDQGGLNETGLTIGTVAGDIITASGQPDQIRAAAALPGVLRLEGARQVRRK